MSADPTAVHRVRSALNGLVLQLEVAAAARDKGDADRLGRALDAARAAAALLTERLDALDAGDAPAAPEADP